jgi:hypothetical protein
VAGGILTLKPQIFEAHSSILTTGEERLVIELQTYCCNFWRQPAGQAAARNVNAARLPRSFGRATCPQTDAGNHQVRNGMAWAFDRYAEPASPLYSVWAAAISD